MRRARQGFALLRCFERSPCPNEHVLLCLARPFAADAVALKPSHSGPPTASRGEWGGPGATEQRLRQTVGLTEVSAVVDAAGLVWKVRHTTSDGLKKDGDGAKPDSTAARRLLQPVQSILRYVRGHTVNHFKALFLPTGYPSTVKPNYERYIAMQAFQNVVASTNAIVSSTFLLYAVGLDAGAIPVAGALNWIIKDGVGQVGTLVFGRIIAHDFDINTRSWHFWSALTINVACAAEIVTAWFPGYFLVLGSLANMLKGLSWMAGGSTRAAFNVSFARGENIADITAKGTSQFICTSLIGTAVGVVICSVVGSDAGLALACSGVLGVLNAAATWSTIRSVPLATLNHTRMQLLMEQYLRLNAGRAVYAAVPLATPSQLCSDDPVVHVPALLLDRRFEPSIEVGTPLCTVLDPMLTSSREKLHSLLRVHKDAQHLVLRDGRTRASRVHIILRTDATPADSVAAMLHAVLLRRAVRAHGADSVDKDEEARLIAATLTRTGELRESLLQSMRDAEWNLDRVCIENNLYRASW